MMGFTSFMQMANNPQWYVQQQMFSRLIREHPKEWQQCQQMFSGKEHKQQVKELRNLYKQKGMDLDAVAKQYGITL